ncbi:VOC family protein [Micromonospora sp. SD19]|uniref:VOC family protein n=1 Tax=Micromonospora parva TaxID=1464048 RepID=UPI00366E7D71
MRISFIRLLVSDFPACFRFYRDAMGFPVTWGDEDGAYAEFDTGTGTRLALNHYRIIAEAVGTDGKDVELPSTDRFTVVFEVSSGEESLEKIAARVQEHGVTLIHPPTDYPDWGIRAVHFRDPDGYLVEVNEILG